MNANDRAMTSPAERMRERALALAQDMWKGERIRNPWEFAAEVATSLAQSERLRALEEAAKAVCGRCKNPSLAKAKLFGNVWGHPVGNENYVACMAAAIHAMREEK